MRIAPTIALLASACIAFAQTPPNFIPRVNASGASAGTNTTLVGAARIGTGNMITNPITVGPLTFWQGSGGTNLAVSISGPGVLFTIAGVQVVSFQPGGISITTNLAVAGDTLVAVTNTPSVAADSTGKLIHGGTTNTWGNTVVPFDRGPNLMTNMAGNLTITGVTGTRADVWNQVFIRLLPGASDRTLTVPGDWQVGTNTIAVGAFTNATTATLPSGTRAWLMVECLPGVETNGFLLPAY